MDKHPPERDTSQVDMWALIPVFLPPASTHGVNWAGLFVWQTSASPPPWSPSNPEQSHLMTTTWAPLPLTTFPHLSSHPSRLIPPSFICPSNFLLSYQAFSVMAHHSFTAAFYWCSRWKVWVDFPGVCNRGSALLSFHSLPVSWMLAVITSDRTQVSTDALASDERPRYRISHLHTAR